MVMTAKGFKHIGVQRGVAKNRPTLIGHRLEPAQVVAYGSKEEAMEEYGITLEQADECHRYVKENGG